MCFHWSGFLPISIVSRVAEAPMEVSIIEAIRIIENGRKTYTYLSAPRLKVELNQIISLC